MPDSILVLAAYGAVLGAYLVVIPGILMFYFKARWFKTGAVERVFLCLSVFIFLPGLLLVAPFLNFRPQPRQI
ncbi:MAG: NAD(P)H-quinone oxidoreductase subunit L [Pseudanabaenaceae cyanobacterium bins.68]|nr:NAD(P)H-quinone oxidoreductase subunit L [Pseudanabaenaceae cyanobacterium bins.68]